MNEDTKNILQSKTVWGAVALLVMTLLKAWNKVPLGLDAPGLADQLYTLGMAIAGVATIAGRVVATKQITVLPAGKDQGSMTNGQGGGTMGGAGAVVLLIGMLLGAGAVVNCSGCAAAETNRVAQSMIAVQTQAKNVDDLVNANPPLITAAQAATLQRMVHDQQTAVKAYYLAIQANDSTAMAAAKAALATGVSELAAELLKYPHITPTPITLPTTTRP